MGKDTKYIAGIDKNGVEIYEGNLVRRTKNGSGVGVVMYFPPEFMCVGSDNYETAKKWEEWPWGNLWLCGENGGFGLSGSGNVPEPEFEVIGDIRIDSKPQKDFEKKVKGL